jgi:hypothetical protein
VEHQEYEPTEAAPLLIMADDTCAVTWNTAQAADRVDTCAACPGTSDLKWSYKLPSRKQMQIYCTRAAVDWIKILLKEMQIELPSLVILY